MPPRYQPLQIPQALSGPPPGVFDQQATPYEDFERKEAALLAQRLNNQSVGISVDQRQQAYDDQQAERAAVKAKFGAGQGMPDESEVLSVLERLALERGDTNSVMEIQRLRNSNAGLKIRQQSVDTYADSIANQRDNSIDKRGRLDASIQSLAPGGWEVDIDPETKQGPNKENGKKFTAAADAHTKIHGYLDQLDGSLATGGGNDPTDPEFIRQKQLISAIQVAFKEKNNFGAALTANEQLINDAQLPRILARTDVSVGRAMVEAGLGRDPRDAIQNLRQILEQELSGQASIYKFKRKSANRNPDDLANSLAKDPQADEETAYKEQYKAKLRAQRGM